MQGGEPVSKLMVLRSLLEPDRRQALFDKYDDDYFKSLIPLAVYYKRFESLELVFNRLQFSEDLDLKQKIALWQLLAAEEKR